MGKDLADGGANGFVRAETNLAVLLTPDKADGQATPNPSKSLSLNTAG